MENPVILAVVADEPTQSALARDLERRFGDDYRVIVIGSATRGLTLLEGMRRAGDEVAIVISGQHLPEMSGFDFLDRADDQHSAARRGMLTSPGPAGMTEAIRRALILDHLDFDIAVPWASPEEWLYPTLTNALSTWIRLNHPQDKSVTIVDHRWGARGHELRDLLDRSGVPYGSCEVDSSQGRDLLATNGVSDDRLPVAIHRDGTIQVDPSNEELARALGVATQPPAGAVDVTIIGAGPAGLAAAVYGASEGLRTVVVEAGGLGGQAATSNLILNYLGFPQGLSGRELTNRAYWQARLFGTEFVFTRRVISLDTNDGVHRLTLDNGTAVVSRAVVLATGNDPRRLGVPTLDHLIGRGVYYGATAAEAAALHGEDVYVVGGGNSAGQASLHLAKHAAHVALLIRGDALGPGMSEYLIQQLEEAGNITIRLHTQVVDGIGQRRLRGLVLERTEPGADPVREQVSAAALFVEIGGRPDTGWLPETVARDERGTILTGRDLLSAAGTAPRWTLDRVPYSLETSVPGVFAAGDVVHGSIDRIASAVGDGAVAIRSVQRFLTADPSSSRDLASPALAASRRAS